MICVAISVATSSSQREAGLVAQLPHDAQPRGKLRRRQLAGQAAGKPRDQLRPQRTQFGQAAVAGQDDLPALGRERIERVEQFFERPLLAGEELQVVDRQQVRTAAFLAKARQAAAANRFDKARRELLGRQINRRRAGVMPAVLLLDRPQQVRFADARRPAEHERRRLLPAAGRQFGRAKRILVAGADDKTGQARVPSRARWVC